MKIKLINMPFADLSIPSIALSQLKAISEKHFPGKVEVDIHYLNHDFARYLTVDHYNFFSLTGNANNSGLGDWFFTQAAHPNRTDNTKEYLERYGPLIGLDFLQQNGAFLLEKRQGLEVYMDGLIDKYDLADADLVGFTSMFMQNVANIAMARRIKMRNRDTVIVMGGANCETPMGEEIAKNFEVIDYIFSGTALVSFPKLLGSIMTGNRSEAEVINGVFTKNNSHSLKGAKAKVVVTDSGEVHTVGPIGDELPLNEYMPLDYDSFLDSADRLKKITDKVKPYLLFETSRGCWWGAKAHCTFCGLNGGGMSYRAMKSELAVEMLNDLFARYGDRVKHFSCVDNIIPREYITDVFPNLKRSDDITMFYEVRADLTPEEMDVLSKAGVVEVQPGIEALNTSTLKLMRKGTSAFNNIRFLQNVVRYSIRPRWNLLIGFPGEDEAVYEKYYNDIPSLFHLPPPDGSFMVRFDRYSPYFMQAEKYNLDLHPLDYYYYNYSLPEETLMNLCYYFSDHNYDADYVASASKWVAKLQKRVAEWKLQWRKIGESQFPKLFFSQENGVDIIVDARTEQVRRIVLEPGDKEVLENLEQRKNMEGLQAQLVQVPAAQLAETVARLYKERLVFMESGTYMNLVFDKEPFITNITQFH